MRTQQAAQPRPAGAAGAAPRMAMERADDAARALPRPLPRPLSKRRGPGASAETGLYTGGCWGLSAEAVSAVGGALPAPARALARRGSDAEPGAPTGGAASATRTSPARARGAQRAARQRKAKGTQDVRWLCTRDELVLRTEGERECARADKNAPSHRAEK